MEALENKTIEILKATTRVNSTSKKSRIEGMSITFGKVIFSREDGLFFENLLIDGILYRPFLSLETNCIELDNTSNSRSKTIIIREYK
jgi:hypothetical protein